MKKVFGSMATPPSSFIALARTATFKGQELITNQRRETTILVKQDGRRLTARRQSTLSSSRSSAPATSNKAAVAWAGIIDPGYNKTGGTFVPPANCLSYPQS